MKRYLADILTLIRLILGCVLCGLVFSGTRVEVALVIFSLGELTDAFDGYCATKWPFPKGQAPKYRRWAEKYDMVADMLLLFAAALFVTVRLCFWFGLSMSLLVVIISMIVELIAYGKLLGHPNDFRAGSLYDKAPKKAEKLLLLRRKLVYIPSIVLTVFLMIFKTTWAVEVKIGVVVVVFMVGVMLWEFLKPRRKSVARKM